MGWGHICVELPPHPVHRGRYIVQMVWACHGTPVSSHVSTPVNAYGMYTTVEGAISYYIEMKGSGYLICKLKTQPM